jgi:uncharacterized SAM-binding protein YcdF (DUF218 family)
LQVNKAKPQTKQFTLFDGGGLFLLVSPPGGKLWRFKYRYEGKQKLLALGKYPEISLDDARSSRDAAKELLTKGIDPSALRKEEKAREKAEHLEAERVPSVRITIDGKVEIWKGGNIMRLTWDEARFVANLLANITR